MPLCLKVKGNDDGGYMWVLLKGERGKVIFNVSFTATFPDCTTPDFTSLIMCICVYVLQCTFCMHTVLAWLYKNQKSASKGEVTTLCVIG